MSNLFKNLLGSFERLPPDADPFRRLIVLLNMGVPLLCFLGLVFGIFLAWRKNGWGYYLILVCALVLAAEAFLYI